MKHFVVLGFLVVVLMFFVGGLLSPLESPREYALKAELAATHASAASTIIALRENIAELEQENAELNAAAKNEEARVLALLDFSNILHTQTFDAMMSIMTERIERITDLANIGAPGEGSPWVTVKRFADARDAADDETPYLLFGDRLRACMSLEEFREEFGVMSPRARGNIFLGQSIAPGETEAVVIYDDGTPLGGGPYVVLLKNERGRWVISLPEELEGRCAEAAANIQRFS